MDKIIKDCMDYCEDHKINYNEFKKLFCNNYDSFYIDVENNTIYFFKMGDFSKD